MKSGAAPKPGGTELVAPRVADAVDDPLSAASAEAVSVDAAGCGARELDGVPCLAWAASRFCFTWASCCAVDSAADARASAASRCWAVTGSAGVTDDALIGSSVEERSAASSAAREGSADAEEIFGGDPDGGSPGGTPAVESAGKSLSGDWIASSCEGGKLTFGDAGAVSAVDTSGFATPGFETSAGVPDGDGVPGVPAFSGLFSLMTVGRAPSTRTNEYDLIIRYRAMCGKPAHNCSHCYATQIVAPDNVTYLWIRLFVESFAQCDLQGRVDLHAPAPEQRNQKRCTYQHHHQQPGGRQDAA